MLQQKEGRQAVHQITKEGFKVAQRGLQEYSDAELNSMRTGMFGLNDYYCYKVVITKNVVYVTENRNNLQVASSSAVTQARSGTLESQDHQKVQKDLNYKETFDDNGDIITDGTSDADSYLRKAVESMVGNIENDALTVDDLDLEEVFEKYCDECENEFE